MIELPEAVVLAGQINQTLSGKQITQTVANQSPHAFAWYTGDPAAYPHLLNGRTIQHADGYGNHVEILAEDRTLVISTPIHYHAAGAKLPKKHQLLITFSDGTAISCTVQMWGAMMCLNTGEPGGMPDYQIAKQRPSPLSPAFDRECFDSLFDDETPKLSTKEFLATKQRIPGLGNGVLQDILWTARLHPRRKMATLSDEDRTAMFEAVKSVLDAMTRQGGRDTERDLFGRPGGYPTVLSKNTVDRPCPRCQTFIQKQPFMGGSIYFCEVCQPERA